MLSADEIRSLLRLEAHPLEGMRPQRVVRSGVWQGARLVPGGQLALLGTTMAPGFDAADFEAGDEAVLARGWPEFRAAIASRTRRA